MREEEIREAQKSLEHAITKKESNAVLDIVARLKRGVVATESLLRSTKLGIVVGKLRTHEDKKVADLAKETVRKWKNDVAGQKDKPAGSSAQPTKAASPVKATSPVMPAAISSVPAPVAPSNGITVQDGVPPAKKVRDAKSDGISKSVVGEKIRDSCIILLYNGICIDSTESSSHVLSVTKSLEHTIFKQHTTETERAKKSAPGGPYRAKIRSLYQNLKSNSALRETLIAGQLSVERLSTMTSEEMASQERREENQKLQEMNIFNAKGAAPKNATTNEFMCGKCKQRKVSYYQMQTRSADEPMTSISLFNNADLAFCLCEVCGNRWKF